MKIKGKPALRNPVATHPLMSKGAAHGKPRKAERKRDKASLRRDLRRGFDSSRKPAILH